MQKKTDGRATASRKQEHVDLTLRRNVGFRAKTTGLEAFEFVHNALPELNLSDLETSVTFLGHTLSLPFMISCMTGGYANAAVINRQLAEVCEERRIAMGVGSQRQALEDTRYHRSFVIAREAAPSIPIVGNIGAAEVARMKTGDDARRLVDLIRADGFTVHLNPVQEFLQPEGDTDFRGVLKGIERLVKELPVPVIVKEIGAGISAGVAKRLFDAGVRYIDVAGAGGTSWAGVETLRNRDRNVGLRFWDWGIPTADALRDVAALKQGAEKFTLIASGGITTGLEAATCIALGADLVGSARPMLQALHHGGRGNLLRVLDTWARELRGAMFLTGSATIADLQRAPLVRYGAA